MGACDRRKRERLPQKGSGGRNRRPAGPLPAPSQTPCCVIGVVVLDHMPPPPGSFSWPRWHIRPVKRRKGPNFPYNVNTTKSGSGQLHRLKANFASGETKPWVERIEGQKQFTHSVENKKGAFSSTKQQNDPAAGRQYRWADGRGRRSLGKEAHRALEGGDMGFETVGEVN